jgi:acyl-CoA reductase-like NAD-dependent aldehyde dehydrogenase
MSSSSSSLSQVFEVKDKYHQTILAKIEGSSHEEAIRKLVRAKTCFEKERGTSSEVRHDRLMALYMKLKERASEMIELIIKEAGKPRSYAQGEVERSLITLKWAADECLRFGGEVVPMDFGVGKGRQAFTGRFPLGVCLGIAPFNFPLNLAMHKLAPAIATGNTILIKPSPYTPLSLLKLEEWCRECGWPEGLFQVVVCNNEVSEMLVTHEDIKLLSFTGSPQVGWMLKEKAGKKKVVLELGGNAGVIVDDTVDLAKTARLLAQGAFLYSGQICISTQRIYCTKGIKEKLIPLLVQATEKMTCGDPGMDKVSVGPLIDLVHLNRVESWVNEAVEKGARVLTGGKVLDREHHIFAPTILEQTRADMKVVCEEVFGPVVIVEEVENFEEALNAINNSKFGLQVGVFTDSVSRMKEAFVRLEVGGIIMNNIPGFRVDSMPYGGVKDSGLGREGLRYAMEDMTEPRLLVF